LQGCRGREGKSILDSPFTHEEVERMKKFLLDNCLSGYENIFPEEGNHGNH